MKKKLAPIIISFGLISLAGCSDDNGNGNNENDETEFGNVLSTSDAGDVTTDDILNQIGTSTVANQTFQLTLDNILKDKYSDEVDTEQIESQTDEEIEQMGGEDQFAMALQQQQPGMTVEKYKEQRITNAYHDKFFEEKFEVTDEKAMENTREASHILIAVKDEESEESEAPQQQQAPESDLTDEEAKKKAEDIKKQLDEGADFGELAKEESHDTGSAENNGSLGYVQKGQMVEGFDKALFKLEKGEVSDVVKSEFGYHIIKRHDEENIEDELPQIKQQMVSKEIQENQDKVLEYYKEVLEEYNADFENEDIKTFIEDTYLDPESQQSPEQPTTEQPAEDEDASAEDASEEETAEDESTEENAE
ncbi:MAG TPA: peptidylprolyl isomerase [Candidatus Salinicoccus stercoripullorum]|uniref:peptidylprolyl isomerase n=1 Tax=Candidatus Salinicoccus stercoripullorum TaxID=2838756 RepID=A0A9D1QHQ0_9STAP|nr:peptidylprolyl isomerase [Candidatus Salinicoccus stercoripullorum]